MPSSLNGTGVTFNDATTLQSGNIPAANLGSGTASSSTFLRGDKTWATVPASAPSTNDVLSATAGASLGAVGTYAFLGQPSNTNANFTAGTNYAGSGLRFTGIQMLPDFQAFDGLPVGATPSGTWKAMGTTTSARSDARRATLFLRIS
jgi:hypothetical protein